MFSTHGISFEGFESLDNEPIDNSIIKRDLWKVYHQQGANLNDTDQYVEFIFGENNIYYQIGNAFPEHGITIRDADNSNFNDEAIRFVNVNLAFIFQKGGLTATKGSDLELNKNVAQVSTIIRRITSKDGDL